MNNLTYQVKIATIIFSLLLFKIIICDNNLKIKDNNFEENEYNDDIEEINHESDEDLNQDYDNKNDEIVEKENQFLEQLDDQYLNSNQSGLMNLKEMFIKLKKTNLNIYRKLSVNDMFININDDENESNNDNLVIKAYYKDDVQYDCELPEEYNLIETYDWLINGYKTGMNESSYNIILDKKIDAKNTFLNVTCMFKLLNQTNYFYIHFPIVHLGNYF